jgi:hypothetical protein
MRDTVNVYLIVTGFKSRTGVRSMVGVVKFNRLEYPILLYCRLKCKLYYIIIPASDKQQVAACAVQHLAKQRCL